MVDMNKDPIQTSEDVFAHIFEVSEKRNIKLTQVKYQKSSIKSRARTIYSKGTYVSVLRQDWSTFASVSTVQLPRAKIIVYLGNRKSSAEGKIFSSVIISLIHSNREHM